MEIRNIVVTRAEVAQPPSYARHWRPIRVVLARFENEPEDWDFRAREWPDGSVKVDHPDGVFIFARAFEGPSWDQLTRPRRAAGWMEVPTEMLAALRRAAEALPRP